MLTKNHLTQITENILLVGETGTGKSHLSKWIHENSLRSHFLFFQINITSLSKNLFESELFGHKKGSFTGATNDKEGFCERVGRGTLFLDEIGELDLEQQKVLLTLLEERIYYSVGSQSMKSFKGSFIFATNKNLEKEVKEGRFREDLYHRLRAYTYKLDSLHMKKDKIQLITDEFYKTKLKHNKNHITLSKPVMEFLKHYRFPGNFRELKQILDYCVFLSDNKIEIEHLPHWCHLSNAEIKASDSYYSALEIFEKNFLQEKLNKFQGRINFTAQMIEISKVTLISKIKKYGINIGEYKIRQQSFVS